MTKYYSINGKLTKFGIKDHNKMEQESIAGYERAIEWLEKCEMKEVDRAPMIDVLKGYIARHKQELL